MTINETKRATLSVGEAARRLDVSADTIRNYCERGWLHCIRSRGKHRRISLRSIESFESQKHAGQLKPESPTLSAVARPVADEEFEIYYLGNEAHPNDIELGYICNASQFGQSWKGVTPSSIFSYVAQQFGGGAFRIARVLDGNVVSERTVQVPGATKDEVLISREIALD
jgi:excisionase family DNA binding protein